ncbi:hydrolase [Poritiphilus flavus]|uniref:Uncharacterized protein n=1 Tax=Poritiphilus flavus TaxID=2697053 RepID=A0A6L9EC97_9FLAO|nr:hydrolase [Poritiphilus flavus]NAS12272.1 hypothetical protein [Poritiphilus flavus]
MSNTIETQKDECCPTFHPEKWDEKTFDWENKPFIEESVPSFLHIPSKKMLGKKIRKMMKLAEDSDKIAEDKTEVLLLFMDPHAFKSNIYLSVKDAVPNAKNTTLTGKFMTKVFDGPFKAIPKFIKQMDVYLKDKMRRAEDYYVHYAYCPKCSEERGKNYMVFFAKVNS